uniref:Uncharacterized protein n=1 Tax=Myoviridae sp. ctvxP16 TaxID=2825205 RepID=A0A8S5UU09_9CAUD|nr:MAG TPA: hypothetical protein [Myoviridae sp. ctvxP16]
MVKIKSHCVPPNVSRGTYLFRSFSIMAHICTIVNKNFTFLQN